MPQYHEGGHSPLEKQWICLLQDESQLGKVMFKYIDMSDAGRVQIPDWGLNQAIGF